MKHYIYIPGFNDRFDFLRRLALLRWRTNTSSATLVAMRWSNKTETYEQKHARVTRVINRTKKDKVILVGESAGGAMALLVFAHNLDRVDEVITICGYNHGSTSIHAKYRRDRLAFYDTVQEAERVFETLPANFHRRIMTIYSTADRVVRPAYSRIDGAREQRLHTKGHLRSIIRVLLKGPNDKY